MVAGAPEARRLESSFGDMNRLQKSVSHSVKRRPLYFVSSNSSRPISMRRISEVPAPIS